MRSRVASAAGPTKFSTAFKACSFDMVPVLFMSYMLNMVDKSSSLKRHPTKFTEDTDNSSSCPNWVADCIWRRMSTRWLFTSVGLWYIREAVNTCNREENGVRGRRISKRENWLRQKATYLQQSRDVIPSDVILGCLNWVRYHHFAFVSFLPFFLPLLLLVEVTSHSRSEEEI